MNQYEIVNIQNGKVITTIRAANRKEAAKQAKEAGHTHFRVRRIS